MLLDEEARCAPAVSHCSQMQNDYHFQSRISIHWLIRDASQYTMPIVPAGDARSDGITDPYSETGSG